MCCVTLGKLSLVSEPQFPERLNESWWSPLHGFLCQPEICSRPSNVYLLSLLPYSGESQILFISKMHCTFILSPVTSFIRTTISSCYSQPSLSAYSSLSVILRSVAGEIFIEHVFSDFTPARTLQRLPIALKEAPELSLLPPYRGRVGWPYQPTLPRALCTQLHGLLLLLPATLFPFKAG